MTRGMAGLGFQPEIVVQGEVGIDDLGQTGFQDRLHTVFEGPILVLYPRLGPLELFFGK